MSFETQEKIVSELGKIEDIDDRFTWLIKHGRKAGELPED